MEKDLDKKLYNDYLNGDKEAFELLYNKYKNKIEYFIFNIVKDYQKAEDLTQETFIYVMQNSKKEESSFKYFVYLVARSKAFNYINVEKRRNEISSVYLNDNEPQIEKDVLEIIEKEETKKEVLEAINLLDEKYKNAIYLTSIEGLTYEETSQILEETLQNTKSLIHRGKKNLRKILLKKGFEEMNKVSKVIIIVLCAGILLSGVAFSKDISNFIKSFFGLNTSEGVDTAVNNGFISEVEPTVQSADGIDISVTSFLIDDYNFCMNFNLKLSDNYDVEEFKRVEFTDISILDENGDIVFDVYSISQNVNPAEIENHYMGAHSVLSEKIGEREFKISLSATGASKPFPKSKKLIVDFNELKTRETIDEENIYEGKWHFELDVPEEMYNRETVIYKVKSCNDNKTVVDDASLSNTAFKMSIPVTTTDKIDYKTLFDRENMKSIYSLIALQKEYIETSDGKKFEPSGRSDGDGGYSVPSDENKITDYHQTFNLTKYDATDTLKVHIFTNIGKEIIIEYEKAK